MVEGSWVSACIIGTLSQDQKPDAVANLLCLKKRFLSGLPALSVFARLFFSYWIYADDRPTAAAPEHRHLPCLDKLVKAVGFYKIILEVLVDYSDQHKNPFELLL
jgi:hypothetical protein